LSDGLTTASDSCPDIRHCVVKLVALLTSSESGRLVVVLVSPRNPLNIGAAARAMTNFGFRRLRVVNPYEVAFRQARSAVGAAHVLTEAEEHPDVASAVADCSLVVGTTAVRHRQLQHPLQQLEEAAGLMRAQLHSRRVALMFGSEKYGLSKDDMGHCNWLLNIPTHEDQISMNLGQAVALCLYELARAAPPEGPEKDFHGLPAGEAERITAALLNVLRTSGYVKRGTADSAEEKTRRLVRRLNLQGTDGKVLLGMLRKIMWKLSKGK
jgi:TrmH family RNA methyltransferase